MNDIDKESPNSPIYLTRGGNVDLPAGALRRAGYGGYAWTGGAYFEGIFAYSMPFSPIDVDPSPNGDRWYGFAVWGFDAIS